MLTENVVAPAVSANEFAQKRAMGARPLYVAAVWLAGRKRSCTSMGAPCAWTATPKRKPRSYRAI